MRMMKEIARCIVEVDGSTPDLVVDLPKIDFKDIGRLICFGEGLHLT